MATTSSLPIAIIGGGLTGCAAAYRLHQQHRRVRLFEASDRLGGVIRSERSGEWLVEFGPNSMREDSPEITKLLAELRLDTVVSRSRPEAKHRYIVSKDQLVPAPASPKDLFGCKLFGFGTKAKLATESLRRPKPRESDVSLAQLIREHFGDEITANLLDPFVAGVYAGDAEKLSAKHAFPALWEMEQQHGSILRGFQSYAEQQTSQGRQFPAPLISFNNGLVALPRALSDPLPVDTVVFGAKIEQIQPGAPWRLTWSRDGQSHTEEFESVILALPAPALARLPLGANGATPLSSLDAIQHPPLATIFLGYTRSQVTHPLDGFGMLVPSSEKKSILGVIFSSSVFTRRAPVDSVGLTVMVGGTRRPELATMPADKLLTLVRRDLTELLGVTGQPVFARHQAYLRSIPQYNLGYEKHLATMAECEQAHSRLFIGGQARDGISVNACLASGFRLADRALS